MNVAFHTDRLRVYRLSVDAADQTGKRFLFAGFCTDEDPPVVAVSALVNTSRGIDGSGHVEWLETAGQCQRQDFASELLEGIARHLRCRLTRYGVNPEGRASRAVLIAPYAVKMSTLSRSPGSSSVIRRTSGLRTSVAACRRVPTPNDPGETPRFLRALQGAPRRWFHRPCAASGSGGRFRHAVGPPEAAPGDAEHRYGSADRAPEPGR